MIDALRRLGQVNIDDAALASGTVVLSVGAALVYVPAGLLVFGTLLLVAGWLLAGDDA